MIAAGTAHVGDRGWIVAVNLPGQGRRYEFQHEIPRTLLTGRVNPIGFLGVEACQARYALGPWRVVETFNQSERTRRTVEAVPDPEFFTGLDDDDQLAMRTTLTAERSELEHRLISPSAWDAPMLIAMAITAVNRAANVLAWECPGCERVNRSNRCPRCTAAKEEITECGSSRRSKP